jgi:hypothetical protein
MRTINRCRKVMLKIVGNAGKKQNIVEEIYLLDMLFCLDDLRCLEERMVGRAGFEPATN